MALKKHQEHVPFPQRRVAIADDAAMGSSSDMQPPVHTDMQLTTMNDKMNTMNDRLNTMNGDMQMMSIKITKMCKVMEQFVEKAAGKDTKANVGPTKADAGLQMLSKLANNAKGNEEFVSIVMKHVELLSSMPDKQEQMMMKLDEMKRRADSHYMQLKTGQVMSATSSAHSQSLGSSEQYVIADTPSASV